MTTLVESSLRKEAVRPPGLQEAAPRMNAASLQEWMEGLRRRFDQLLQEDKISETRRPEYHGLLADAFVVHELGLELIEDNERKLAEAERRHEELKQKLGNRGKPRTVKKATTTGKTVEPPSEPQREEQIDKPSKSPRKSRPMTEEELLLQLIAETDRKIAEAGGEP